MWTFLTTPMMSVNCRLTKRTPASLACLKARSFSWGSSLIGICVLPFSLDQATAEGRSNFQRQLQVETGLRVLQVGPAQELLNAFQSIDQRVAMDVQVARGPHLVAARAQKSVQSAH